MAYSVETTARTPITQLRESLDKGERLVVQIDGKNIAEFLTLLDSIETQLETLVDSGVEIRSEQGRWDSLLQRINNQPDPIVRAASVAGGMDKLRAEHPPAASFWWNLDSEIARRRAKSIQRIITTAIAVVVIAVGGFYAIDYFFPPNAEAVLMLETTNGIDRLLAEGKWQEALDLVKSARAQSPNNAELMVWESVLSKQNGDDAAADAAFNEAQTALAETPVQAWIYLGNTRMRVGDIDGALLAAQEAQKIAPEEPQVSFLLGNIAETQGELSNAISYFEQTFQLAEGSNPQLAVIARVRMGQLMQNPGSLVPSETEPVTDTVQ